MDMEFQLSHEAHGCAPGFSVIPQVHSEVSYLLAVSEGIRAYGISLACHSWTQNANHHCDMPYLYKDSGLRTGCPLLGTKGAWDWGNRIERKGLVLHNSDLGLILASHTVP